MCFYFLKINVFGNHGVIGLNVQEIVILFHRNIEHESFLVHLILYFVMNHLLKLVNVTIIVLVIYHNGLNGLIALNLVILESAQDPDNIFLFLPIVIPHWKKQLFVIHSVVF